MTICLLVIYPVHMTYQVTGIKVLLSVINEDKIIIPDEQLGHGIVRGLVVSAGRGRPEFGSWTNNLYEEGNFVWFDVGDARRITLDSKDYYIINQDDILVLEEEE